MAVNFSDGKEAKSICRVLNTHKELSVVEIQLLTGRTHQIRVHLKYLGTPILGDVVYGSSSANKNFNTSRQLLHAHRLQFKHPITGNSLNLTAQIPKDILHYTTYN
jgi:23S rRNA pseudouridine1911/1915/1917 synthase